MSSARTASSIRPCALGPDFVGHIAPGSLITDGSTVSEVPAERLNEEAMTPHDTTNHEAVDSILAQARSCLEPVELATSLPAAAFNDPGWFDAERTRLFHAGWVAVARSSEVAEPNSFATATIAGEPCIVVRDSHGTLRAMSNVCPHRATVIVGDAQGSARSLQCPYHLWTFGQDGALRGAPGMDQAEDFNKTDVALPHFAVDEWQGFVLVNIDANAKPFRDTAPSLDALFTEQQVGECVSMGQLQYPSPWNWKITVDNFLESYHHRGIHPSTIEPSFPGANSFGVLNGDEPWSGVDHVSAVDDREPFIALAAYPSLLVAIDRGVGFYWFRTEPVSTDQTMLTIESFVRPELVDVPDIGEQLLTSVAAINEEDIWVNERTAAGLRSRFATPGRLSHLEASPWHFHRWLIRQMSLRP